MEKTEKSKLSDRIFFIIFGFLILGSIVFTYCRVVIEKDYIISAETDCDPYSEKCFIYVCDPATEECTGDPEEDNWYYKIIKRKAYNIPSCNPNDEECDALICPNGEEDCGYAFCEEGNEDGVECNDPEQYTVDNPPEEGCEEGDEECLNEEAECEERNEECVQTEESEEEIEASEPVEE